MGLEVLGDNLMMKFYTQNNCPQCRMVSDLLKSKKIQYQECQDIEMMKKIGLLRTPAIEVDGKLLQGKEMFQYINEAN